MLKNHVQLGTLRRNNTLVLIAKFGHIRAADLAVFLNGNPSEGNNPNLLKAAERILKKLRLNNLVLKRANGLGSSSYVLTTYGACYVRDHGLYPFAKTGKDLNCSGSTFYHHCLGNIGSLLLMSLARLPLKKYITEAEIYKNIDPTEGNSFNLCKQKLPFTSDGYFNSSADSLIWVEVENSAKSKGKIKEKLDWLIEALNSQSGELSTKDNNAFAFLKGIAFIIPTGIGIPNHEAYIRSIIDNYIMEDHSRKREDKWYFLRLNLSDKLHLLSYELVHMRRWFDFNNEDDGLYYEENREEKVISSSII